MPDEARPAARFDDRVSGSASVFERCDAVLSTSDPGDVAALLGDLDAATRDGWWAFGYVAYEAAPGLDPALVVRSDPDAGDPASSRPLVWFGLSRDHRVVPMLAPPAPATGPPSTDWVPDVSADEYSQAVARVHGAIAVGTTYQCNLTTRLRAPLSEDPYELYARLLHRQRTAYAAYLDLGARAVVSVSPELFFDWTGDTIRTRPMKGTARRGRTTAEDESRRRALLASTKERAENIIVVDLLRNDLSRIARTGTVEVPALLTAERYETLWQLTSDVTAEVGPDVGLVDVFRALFPSGSVTGAPKPATMSLIRDLETSPRGVYCGAIGVVAPSGEPTRARFSVAIRTVEIDRRAGRGTYGVGAGITWGSEANAEYAELRTKARVLTHPSPPVELLETMLFVPADDDSPVGGIRHVQHHLRRLANSAAFFGLDYDHPAVAQQLAHAVVDAQAPLRVRLRLGANGDAHVDLGPAPAATARPVRLVVDDEPIDSGDALFLHKTTQRWAYESRARRHPEADDVVLVNEHGAVTETTIANLAVELDGRWYTPPVPDGCLPGIGRQVLVAEGRLVERSLGVADLRAATSLAVVSSLRGWRDAVLAG